MQEKIIEVRNLNVHYFTDKGKFQALRNICFEIQKGEIFCVVGESGSGKTTLGLSILRILPKNATFEGEIKFKNIDILNCEEKMLKEIRGKEIFMIFQDPLSSFDPLFSIGYQMQEFLISKKKTISRREMSDMIEETLIKVGFREPRSILKMYPHQLSGGMLQRIMIAQALMFHPSLIIADEPTSNLDVSIESQIINLFLKLNREFKITILFITHNLLLVKKIATRIVVLYKGEIVEEGSFEKIYTSSNFYVKQLLQSFEEIC